MFFSVVPGRCRLFNAPTNGGQNLPLLQLKPLLDLEASDADYQDEDFRAEWVAWATEDGVWPFIYCRCGGGES